jgi:hypothetical protein
MVSDSWANVGLQVNAAKAKVSPLTLPSFVFIHLHGILKPPRYAMTSTSNTGALTSTQPACGSSPTFCFAHGFFEFLQENQERINNKSIPHQVSSESFSLFLSVLLDRKEKFFSST